MPFGLTRRRLLRIYLTILMILTPAAYVSGAVTADICSAYDSGTVAERPAAGGVGSSPQETARVLCR
jgi:hypothetical protein